MVSDKWIVKRDNQEGVPAGIYLRHKISKGLLDRLEVCHAMDPDDAVLPVSFSEFRGTTPENIKAEEESRTANGVGEPCRGRREVFAWA